MYDSFVWIYFVVVSQKIQVARLGFFHLCPQDTTSFAAVRFANHAHATSFREKREHHCRPAAQVNDVAPLVQMKLPTANEVMLRINDVALRANGYAFGVIGAKALEMFTDL